MPNDTHETARTQFVQAGDVQFAYRRFGPRRATPLLLCNYFAANMDDWDPKVTNGFAAEHDVILFDYPGIGRSSGETPSTVAALTKHCVAFSRAIGLTQFDVIGFSVGGMIAQQLSAPIIRTCSGGSSCSGRDREAEREWPSTISPSTTWTTRQPCS